MRYFLVFFIIVSCSNVIGKESEKNPENLCKIAINEYTDYQVIGIYGSPLESEWHPVAAYILVKEMYRFKVLWKKFNYNSPPWRFDFVEMTGGKTVVFVYNLKTRFNYCAGPNSFYVKKK